jgi:phosphate transport system substrate-binding protein
MTSAVSIRAASQTPHQSRLPHISALSRCGLACLLTLLLLPLASPAQTLRIEGDSALRPALIQWNSLFQRTHPGVRIQLKLADPGIALGGLTAATVDLALTTRAAWEIERRPFRFVYGYSPQDIPIGRIFCLGPGNSGTAPPAVYVNARNPLRGLTAPQVAQIVTSGQPAGDITQWSQLGLGGDYRPRAIHVYGLRDDGTFATEIRAEHMAIPGLPALLVPDTALAYEPLPSTQDVLHALALDPFGIALLDALSTTHLPPNVRMVPLASADGSPFSVATCSDVAAGRYPYNPYLHIFLSQAPNAAPNPLLRDYVALILSPAGQHILSGLTRTTELLPLTPQEAEQELNHLP